MDYSGRQYWSDVVNILADEETAVVLQLDLLALNFTNDPDPVRFDGKPPVYEPEPIRLASLFDITGILARSVVAQIPESKIYYYINDHLGTPQKMVDESGVVVWSADYRPFGEVNVTANGVGNGFRYPGQYYDAETGLHYNYHRYYDPKTGRYLTSDPIGMAGGINLYGYVGGNPVNVIDPDGQFIQSLVAGGIAGGIVGSITFVSELAKGESFENATKSAIISGATSAVSVGLASTGLGFLVSGSAAAFTNATLQKIMKDNVNYGSALFSGFAISAGGFALSGAGLQGASLGVLAGLVGAPVSLIGDVLFSSDTDRRSASCE